MSTSKFRTSPIAWQRGVVTLRYAMLRMIVLALVVICTASGTKLAAQNTPSDPCVNSGVANRFTVGSACTLVAFNKPAAWAANLTPPGSTCNSGAFGDAFGWFQATSTSTIVTYAPNSNDAVLHVFSGTCAAPVQVACADAGLAGVAETVTVATTIGTNYFFRVQRWNTSANMTGNLCVYNAPPPPVNDNPCGAVSLSVGTSCTYVSSTNSAATGTTGVPAPGCASYTGGDVWFSAVVPASGRLIIDSNTGTITDGGMALYTTAPNTCSGTFTLVECDDDDSVNGDMPMIDRAGLTPGSTVWIRFWGYNGSSGTFQICAYSPAPPANDNPCGAINLTVTANCTAVSATNAFATGTTGPPDPTCAEYAGGDVWFRLTVPASGAVIIETFAGTLTDGGMAVYTAPTCSGTFIQEYCDDDAGPGFMPFLSMTGLAPASTIWVRFWSYDNLEAGTFSICAHTPPPPPAGDCVYVLNLFDSWGDGWGSSNVGVRINNGTWTYYTVGGSNAQVLIGLMMYDFIELSYDASGPFQGENSYSLGLLNGGNYFNSGSAPPAGPSFGQLVDCVPPPAAPQDCNGGFTVCNGQAFNNNSSNTGNIVDLNSANRGCLTLGERQGTWYYFSPSANGVLAFTLAPSVATTDYDFAVWGPMSAVTCPPPSAPARCSYAAATGNTGLGNGAVDNSEGAGGDRWVSPMNVTAGQVYILYVDNFSSNGQAFNMTWQLSGGASLDCTLLPVELINASAETVGSTVVVSWSTLSEDRSDRFIVERSMDGSHFQPIGSVEAAGHSLAPLDYRLQDVAPGVGIRYYRINMVDMDGASTLSPIVSATIDRWNSNLVLAPNPVSDVLNITFRTVPQDGVKFSIIDAAGRLVRDLQVTLPEGSTLARISTQGLDAGSYTLAVFGKDGTPLSFAPFVRE